MKMKTAYDLLIAAPDSQVVRSQIVFKALANGLWLDAAFALRNAANEESSGEWADDSRELAEYCERVAGTLESTN